MLHVSHACDADGHGRPMRRPSHACHGGMGMAHTRPTKFRYEVDLLLGGAGKPVLPGTVRGKCVRL
eukprot:SAG31_NODE_2668_length_5272_cov_14.858883_1_plen_66_part_00